MCEKWPDFDSVPPAPQSPSEINRERVEGCYQFLMVAGIPIGAGLVVMCAILAPDWGPVVSVTITLADVVLLATLHAILRGWPKC